MSNVKRFNYGKTETNSFTSHAVYTNGQLKCYDAFTILGEKVNIFQDYTPIYTKDGQFEGYQDEQGRKVEVRFGNTIYVGAVDENGEMDDTKKAFYSPAYYLSLLEQKKAKER